MNLECLIYLGVDCNLNAWFLIFCMFKIASQRLGSIKTLLLDRWCLKRWTWDLCNTLSWMNQINFLRGSNRLCWLCWILASTPYICVEFVVRWFSPLLREVFCQVLQFSPLLKKTNTFKFQFDLEHTDTFQRVFMNSSVFRGWTNYNLQIYNILSPQMTGCKMIVPHSQGCNVVVFRQNDLMFDMFRQRSLPQLSTNNQNSVHQNEV